VFKNYKRAGGASLEHPHSQIIGLNFIPKRVAEEVENCKEYFLQNEKCIFCSIIDKERKDAKRIIYENESYIAFCPYASFFPYEVQILSKKHKSSILSLDDDEIIMLGDIIKKVHYKYNKSVGDIPYNMYFHFVKDELEYYHFYIKICPRISMHAGLEISTDVMVSAISPEYAAETMNRI
jgi:UDPglucose--hexose-1-phosphate uridylyltransferase